MNYYGLIWYCITWFHSIKLCPHVTHVSVREYENSLRDHVKDPQGWFSGHDKQLTVPRQVEVPAELQAGVDDGANTESSYPHM